MGTGCVPGPICNDHISTPARTAEPVLCSILAHPPNYMLDDELADGGDPGLLHSALQAGSGQLVGMVTVVFNGMIVS